MKAHFLLSTLFFCALEGYSKQETPLFVNTIPTTPSALRTTATPDKGEMESEMDALAKSNQWRKFADVMDDYLKKFGYPDEKRFYNWMLNLKISNIDRSVSKKAVKWLQTHMNDIRTKLSQSNDEQQVQAKGVKLEEYLSAYERIVAALKS